jgi:uncharacterized protein YqeY
VDSSLPDRLRAALPAAMKARDQTRVSVLRTTLSALANAEAVDATGSEPAIGTGANEVTRRTVSPGEAVRIVTAERDDLRTTAEEMHRLDQTEEAAELRARADVLDGFLT